MKELYKKPEDCETIESKRLDRKIKLRYYIVGLVTGFFTILRIIDMVKNLWAR